MLESIAVRLASATPLVLVLAALASSAASPTAAMSAPSSISSISVDPVARRIETSRFVLDFNQACPERIDELIFKDYSATQNLRGDDGAQEFFGQMIRGMWEAQGFISPTPSTQSWAVVEQDAAHLLLRVATTSSGNPPVTTDYTLFPDAPYVYVDRTVAFSQSPQSTSFQAYVPRLAPRSDFTTYRLRACDGSISTGTYCEGGCDLPAWNHTWAQMIAPYVSVTIMCAASNAGAPNLVVDKDASSFSSWAAPLFPTSSYTTDQTFHFLLHFSGPTLTPEELDAVYVPWAASIVGGNGTWAQLCPTGTLPSGRFGHAAICDAPRDRMVVFGGYGGTHLNDTWALTLSGNNEWTRLSPTGGPPSARSGQFAIFDPVRDRMIVGGGWTDGPYDNTMWALSLSGAPTWTQMNPLGTPPYPNANETLDAIYDPVRDRILVYVASGGPVIESHIWTLSLGGSPEWAEVPIAGVSPPGRADCAAVYDSVRDRMLIFGGHWAGTFNDVWALSLGGTLQWQQLAPTGPPPSPRYNLTAVYDPVRDRMVTFGGCCDPFNDTWALSLSGDSEWTRLAATGDWPSGRLGHNAIYDPVRDRMVLFGGLGLGEAYFGDTWALTWGTPGPPAPAAPSNLTTTREGCPPKAHLVWQDNSNDETGYEVQSQVNASGSWSTVAMPPENVTTWTSDLLTYGSTYAYRVRSCKGSTCSTWAISASVGVGPCLIPDTVTWKDTGVDLLIEGQNFQPGASIRLDPPGISMPADWWSATQLHVTLDIDSSLFGGSPLEAINVSVVSGGQASLPSTLSVTQLSVPHPRDYAPTLWFASAEKWFPTSPFFDYAGKTYYDSAQGRNDDYLCRTRETKKLNSTVYYYIHGDPNQPSSLVSFPRSGNTPCIVYEYWTYYTFDEFTQCNSIVLNRHQHDWEKVFVFVGAQDHKVHGIAGSAHLDQNANNVYEFAAAQEPPYHPLVLVELGSHAMCPDMNNNGLFDYPISQDGCTPIPGASYDVNGCAQCYSWGIRDFVADRDMHPEDKSCGPDSGTTRYRLASLNGLKSLVDPRFTEAKDFWPGSCEGICPSLRAQMAEFLQSYDITTFRGSRPVEPDSRSAIHALLPWACQLACSVVGRHLTLAHLPIEHAWQGNEGRYLTEPWRILPDCYGHALLQRTVGATIQAAFGFGQCDMAVLTRSAGSGSWKALASNDSAQGFLRYARLGPDRHLAFASVADGTYSLSISTEAGAPFQQMIQISASDTLLGARGRIALAQRDRYFTLKCRVQDVHHDPIGLARVRFIALPDSLILPTLTDTLGLAFASVDTGGAYEIAVSALGYQDSLTNLSGSVGDTVEVVITAPFDRWDPSDSAFPPALRTELRQNYPNPFNPVTVIDFDLETTAMVHLGISDMRGRAIRLLLSEVSFAGHHRATWDGLDDRGKRVPSGVYLCTLRTGNMVLSKKLVLVK